MIPVSSWISPKTQRGLPSKIHGHGFFAKEDIAKGELMAIKGGHIIDRNTLLQNKNVINDSHLQLTDDLYIAPLTPEEESASMICCNHSCEPNGGWQGQVIFVAMRDIRSGEEITADYALHFNDDIMKFKCNCQMLSCRKVVTGRDWQIPELQKKYSGYFVWYLEQKINNLHK